LPVEVRNIIGKEYTRSFRFERNRNLRMIWNEERRALFTFNPKGIVLSDEEKAARADLEALLQNGDRA
jgi:hypothetical protein